MYSLCLCYVYAFTLLKIESSSLCHIPIWYLSRITQGLTLPIVDLHSTFVSNLKSSSLGWFFVLPCPIQLITLLQHCVHNRRKWSFLAYKKTSKVPIQQSIQSNAWNTWHFLSSRPPVLFNWTPFCLLWIAFSHAVINYVARLFKDKYRLLPIAKFSFIYQWTEAIRLPTVRAGNIKISTWILQLRFRCSSSWAAALKVYGYMILD